MLRHSFIPFSDYIKLSRNKTKALYIQLAEQLAIAIEKEQIPSGTKLPGSREMSKTLQIERKTVLAAFRELEAWGLLDIQANKGSFVCSKSEFSTSAKLGPKSGAKRLEQAGFSFKKTFLLDSPFEHSSLPFILNDGTPDIRLTQLHHLSSAYSAQLKRRSNRNKMGFYNHQGSEYFKHQITHYLNISKGLGCNKENVLITRSTEMALYICVKMLIKAGDRVVIGSPSNFSANMVFQHQGARTIPLKVDRNGLDTRELETLCKKQVVRMVYINPLQHYPTTAVLSEKRRAHLLELAGKHGFIILEDDYDADFYYSESQRVPLFSEDKNAMSVYIGTFGRSLAPGFRTGYLVAPKDLTSQMSKYLGIIDRQGDILMEQALGELIEDGIINRYLRKSLLEYQNRRNHTCGLIKKHFSQNVAFQVPTAGLAIWLDFKENVNLLKLSNACQNEGVFIARNMLYQDRNTRAMRLGFGHLSPQEMDKVIPILAEQYKLEAQVTPR
ncbi:MAG TPA: PLP-dependent aminotransferase family protein [Candidatus Sphingobacterium stercoripullorum]|nr:PLP-dependent aminotransferase family protein [Candidatus Sphingobacterium stercoripullorum]